MFAVQDKIKMTKKWNESLDKLTLLRGKKKKQKLALWPPGKANSFKQEISEVQSDALENYDLTVVTKY